MKRFPLIILFLAAALFLTACNGGENGALGSDLVGVAQTSGGTGDTADDVASSPFTGIPTDQYSASSTRAIVVSAGLNVFNAPDGQVVTTLAPTTSFGTTRVLLMEEQQGEWIKVRLPLRPNHRSGWILADSVELETLELAVYVDLAARTLAVMSTEGVIVESPVAIGSEAYPTPQGTFYVTDKLETPNPAGAYGPYALGLSGFSEQLTEFAGGEGQIGIHGTDDPASIGQAVSHGCLRLPNDLIDDLAQLLPLGTPVHII